MLSMSQLQGFNAGGEHDPYWDDVVLLMHMDGNFTDASKYSHSVTDGGMSLVASPVRYGSGSMQGDTFASASVSNAVLDVSSGDLTVEAWVYLGDTGYIYIVRSSWYFYVAADQKLRAGDGFSNNITSSSPMSLNTWHHVAYVREGSSHFLFVDGVSVGSGTPAFTSTTTYSIGGSGSSQVNYIDELRITKGVARYTTNFTPPVAPFPNS